MNHSNVTLSPVRKSEKASLNSNYSKEIHRVLGVNFTIEKLEDDGHWIFNRNVLQHGTIMSLRKDKLAEIEVMIRFADKREPNRKHLKCLVKLGDSFFIVRQVIEIKKLDSVQVFCLLTEQEYSKVESSRVIVGVFDQGDYKASEKNIIFGKMPNFFDRNVPKQKALMNYACASESISDNTIFEQIIMWAKINKFIGSKKVQVFTTDINNSNFKRLKDKYSDLVETIGYNQDLRALCIKHKTIDVEKCYSQYREFFEHRENGLNWSHQTVRMNDCFMKA
jgi:hypothetical protein